MKNKKTDPKNVEQAKEPQKEVAKAEQKPPKLEGTPVKFWRKDGEEENQMASDPKRFTDGFLGLTGTKDIETAAHIIDRTTFALNPRVRCDPFSMNVACQSFHDQKPKNALEASLVSQAIALYTRGMSYLGMSEKAERYEQMQLYGNLAIKMLRLHNETIEALDRHRRGGEQKVTVVHVADKMAVVNNYGSQGGGVSSENKGNSPCSENAAPNRAPTETSHVVSQPLPVKTDAGCTADTQQAQERQRASSA